MLSVFLRSKAKSHAAASSPDCIPNQYTIVHVYTTDNTGDKQVRGKMEIDLRKCRGPTFS